MDTARTGFFSISPARLTACIAVVALFAVIGWNAYARPTDVTTAQTATSSQIQDTSDSFAAIASSTGTVATSSITELGASILEQAVLAYDGATKNGSSTAAGVAAVQQLGANINPTVDYKTYASSDIKTDSDTSKDRALNYRADLRVALEPLLDNKDLELDLFASYVDTKDPKYLDKLRAAAVNYNLAIANTEKVVAPIDAAIYQASILTAMSQFSATLDSLADNADDPFASAALLKTYMSAQDNMLTSFNAMAKYNSQKTL